jgi:hypothetical protein
VPSGRFGQGAAAHVYSGAVDDRSSALRAAIVGQYVRMAQSMGQSAPDRPVAAGLGFSTAGDITHLQRDVLQAFLEQMGGMKSTSPGIYFTLRA